MGRERRNVIESCGGQMKKMEQALNEWLEKVEEQVNVVEDKLGEKATVGDMQ